MKTLEEIKLFVAAKIADKEMTASYRNRNGKYYVTIKQYPQKDLINLFLFFKDAPNIHMTSGSNHEATFRVYTDAQLKKT